MIKNKKCLVTGGAGFIGSHVVDQLLSLGNEVTVVDNESSDANSEFFWNKETKNFKVDVCDFDHFSPLCKGVDVIFHLAAEARIQPTLENPILAAKTNVVGTCSVLQAAKINNVKRVIYSSTSAAYGLKNTPPQREDMPKDCLNPYSVTKTAGEDLCFMYTNLFNIETVCFRYFNVYGERQPLKGQYAPVIGIFLRQKSNKELMTIVGDGTQRRDFTYVKDIAKANILAANLDNKKPVGELINLGTGLNHSVNEIKDLIGGEFTHIPARLGEAKETQANNNKARELLNWIPKQKLEDWIEKNQSQ
jgi:UDP-glucose 4-epimerase